MTVTVNPDHLMSWMSTAY